MRNSVSGEGGGVVAKEEEEEEFYESNDRIVSSTTCSSTSASDDDNHRAHHSRRHRNAAPSNYDVWLSGMSSVEERRERLLQKFDLIGDPSLSRPKSCPPPPCHLGALKDDEGGVASSDFGRSRSTGYEVDGFQISGALFAKSVTSSGMLDTVGEKEESGCDEAVADGGDADFRSPSNHCVENGQDEEKINTIKNFDSGEKFVVKEVREEGIWNKMQVGGSERQLTLEMFHNSPNVEELMQGQNEESINESMEDKSSGRGRGNCDVPRGKKKRGWFRSIKNAAVAVVHRKERRSSDEKETTSSENGRRRSSSATDDSQDPLSHHGSERVRVRHYGSSMKELTGLYLNQEMHAHNGSIWTLKFSLDGRYLATAGQDCLIHIWLVEFRNNGDSMEGKGLAVVEDMAHLNQFSAVGNGSSEVPLVPSSLDRDHSDKRRRPRITSARKSFSFDNVVVPENVFALFEKPVRSFHGHDKDVLDLSWSRTEHLLSSSMDKTVRLWDLSSSSCLRIFSHNHYVTCVQFNPIDDNHFISGSLDCKVRMWNVENCQVEHWNELHEWVTAACFTPDGQGAFVGSQKGRCHFFKTSDHKLEQKSQINLPNKKNKSFLKKKITGFEFAPGSPSEVFITSADSRIRVVDNLQLVHQFKGFRNNDSQISASLTSDGNYVICASEDSHVYVWKYEVDSRPGKVGFVTETQSHEHFHCRDVTVAVSWPCTPLAMNRMSRGNQNMETCISHINDPNIANVIEDRHQPVLASSECSARSPERGSFTWPEEKHDTTPCIRNSRRNEELNGLVHGSSAWGMVIVTAGKDGEIKAFQNFGYPVLV